MEKTTDNPILFGIRQSVLDDEHQCSLLKEQLERGYNIPLSVITGIQNGIILAHSCIPTGYKPFEFDVTKLPSVDSTEWKESVSLLVKTERESGHEVKWFESTERALYFIEVHNLSK